MTEDTKKSMIWTGGAVAAVIVIAAVLWSLGLLDNSAVQ